MSKSIFLTIAALSLFLFISSIPPQTTLSKLKKSPLDGTWELISHYVFEKNKVKDTIEAQDGFRQIKMYNDSKVMWTRFVPSASAEWFGYGSYEISNGTLKETLEYGSSTMMKMIDTIGVFEFELKYKKNKFSQITLDDKGNRLHSENYIRIK